MSGKRADWDVVRLGNFLSESRLAGSTGATAKKLRIRLYGNGVVANPDETGGSEATRYFRRKAGQLVYSKLDFLNGAFGIVPEALDGFESTSDMPAFDFLNDVDQRWLLAYIGRPAFYQRLKGSAVGSRKARRVNVDEFLACHVRAPSAAEQAGIVAAINLADRQIRANSRSIVALAAQKRVVMSRLLLGDSGSPRETKPLPERWVFGRVADGVERIPVEWDLVRLTSVAKLESGHTPSRAQPTWWDGGIPWVSLGDTDRFAGLTILETAETVSELGIANSSARVLPADTVVFSRTASVGLCSRLGVPMATSQDFANYVCGKRINARYLVQVFRHAQREWVRLKEGSTHKTIYMPVFKALQVLLPPLDEQCQIADIGEAFDLRIAAERAHLDALDELKRGLADALLSGRVRLPPHLITSLTEGATDVGK